MKTHVLVPVSMAEHLASAAPEELHVSAYTYHAPSILARVRRKIGVAGGGILHEKLGLPPRDELAGIEALWLSEQVSLSTREWRALLEQLPGLRWVFSQRTSFHDLDPEMFRSRGIAVSNSGDLVSRWVAEFALASIVAEHKRLPEHVRRHSPRTGPIYGRSFEGTRVVILGTGRIGERLATMCSGLGMFVTGLSRRPERFPDPPTPYARILNLGTELALALSDADFVVVALPSSRETQQILGPEEIRRMPKAATVVSVTHPELIDQAELFAALREGRIASAYLDRIRPPRRFRAARIPNLVLTHNSTAHLREKSEGAMKKFLAGVRAVRESTDPDDRIV